jgi:hypothetical protein
MGDLMDGEGRIPSMTRTQSENDIPAMIAMEDDKTASPGQTNEASYLSKDMHSSTLI